MSQDPILFVSHDAGPTGAPFLLLHLLRWLRDNTKLNFTIVLKKEGTLKSQFAELAPTFVFRSGADSFSGRALEYVRPYRFRRMLEKASLRRDLGKGRFALVYSNTLVNGRLLECLPQSDCPLVSHSHELEYMIKRSTNPRELAYTLKRTSRFIAGSSAVAQNLVDHHALKPSTIDVVHDFIPIDGLDVERLKKAARAVRAELGISPDSFVVGAAGTVDWRKGCDLFIPLALQLLQRNHDANTHFVWVGGFWERRTPLEMTYDIGKLGLQDRIHFLGHRSDYLECLAMFDAFCLMSREDPCPLVMLEAAALGKPILCFAQSGGGPELVEDDCGIVVPYLDTFTMALRLREIIENQAMGSELGRRVQARVRERHDVSVAGPRILDIIQRCVSEAGSKRANGP